MSNHIFPYEPATEDDTCLICGEQILVGDGAVDVCGDLCHAMCLVAAGDDVWYEDEWFDSPPAKHWVEDSGAQERR